MVDKSEQVFVTLHAHIQSGHLAPGKRLSEVSLAQELGVSRSPIRTALARLEHAGLLIRHGLTLAVRQLALEDIMDIYRVRIVLEGMIAADAAVRRQDMDILRLRASETAASNLDGSDPVRAVAANREFHTALAQAAHNRTLTDLQERLTAQVVAEQRSTLTWANRWPEAMDEHTVIVDAVERGDAAKARQLAEQHLARARDIRLELYRHELSQ